MDSPRLTGSIGPYRIVKLIARTPVGAVGWAVGPDGHEVVLKYCRRPQSDVPERPGHPGHDPAAVRFLREASMLRRLQHPGIVSIVDAGADAELLWLAMAPVAGPDLTAFTTPATRLPPADAVHCIADAAEAVDHAHRHGVLHRDLKPSNIVWADAAPGRRQRAVLLDFGVAFDADASADERTATGVVPGSPAYMAPEQLAGALPSVAADVFALGVTLYELLAGARPWQAGSLGALLRSVAQDPPTPLEGHAHGLPAALVAIVHQCLARDPDARPRGAAALAQALRRVPFPP
jgi:eukaryotic-like serine/threonine-protein kinase